jgi:fructose-1,6-bisphosphatase/inositol monophosphatase family enzyme
MSFLKNFIETGNELFEKINSLVFKEERTGYTGMGADGTLTSRLDKLCEDAIINRVEELDLPFNIVSEEVGMMDRKYQKNLVIDPLDGTYNAENQIPAYSMSVAIMENNFDTLQEALVFNLATKNYFYAEKGKGAYRNQTKLEKTTQRTGASVIYSLRGENVPDFLREGINRRRILGCASLEMGFVSNNSIDYVAYIGKEKELRNVDIAAGVLLVRETGGFVLDQNLKPLNMNLDVRERKNMIALSAAYENTLKEAIK